MLDRRVAVSPAAPRADIPRASPEPSAPQREISRWATSFSQSPGIPITDWGTNHFGTRYTEYDGAIGRPEVSVFAPRRTPQRGALRLNGALCRKFPRPPN